MAFARGVESTAMAPGVSFTILLSCTVAALVGAVFAGTKGRLRLHIPLVVLTVVLLGLTVWQARELGELYDLEGSGMIYPVHRFVARLTAFALVLPVVAGVATLIDRSRETFHRRLAWLALALIATTAVTGVILMLRAAPLG